MSRLTIPEEELLQYALIGYQQRRDEVDAAMRDIRGRIDLAATDHHVTSRSAALRRRQLSPEGRAAIVAGVKRRWARLRREKRAKERGHA